MDSDELQIPYRKTLVFVAATEPGSKPNDSRFSSYAELAGYIYEGVNDAQTIEKLSGLIDNLKAV